MKKILIDCESQSGAMAVICREDGELFQAVPAGVEVVNTRDENAVYDILEQDFNVKICKEAKREDFQFYTVPRFTVFATDSYGNALGTLYGAGDISDDDYPVAMVTKTKEGCILANSFKEFLAALFRDCTDIRAKYGFEGFVPTENKADNAEYLRGFFRLEEQIIRPVENAEFEVFASKSEAESKYQFVR